MKSLVAAGCVLMYILPTCVFAQSVTQDQLQTVHGTVISINSTEDRVLPGTETTTAVQTVTVRAEGIADPFVLENDFTPYTVGDRLYLLHTTNSLSGYDQWAISDFYRLPVLVWLSIIFLVSIALFGGIQGVRGVLALALSIAAIVGILLPRLLSGQHTLAWLMGSVVALVAIGAYVTHGFRRTTTAAAVGMLVTLLITGTIAYVAVHAARFTGLTSEEVISLYFNFHGNLDVVSLLFGGLIIGFIGVLYDAAIGQAVAVEELARAACHYSRRELYVRGLRIGREHVGALVNTLAIAYLGTALPLILLVYQIHSGGVSVLLNQELFATEIMRMLIGGIGIVLAMPVSTAVAVWMLHGRDLGDAGEGNTHHSHVHHHS